MFGLPLLSHVHPRAAEPNRALGPCRVCWVSALVLFGAQLHPRTMFTVTQGSCGRSDAAHRDSRCRGAHVKCLPKCTAQARQGLVLTGIPELLTGADTAGKEELVVRGAAGEGQQPLLPAVQGST